MKFQVIIGIFIKRELIRESFERGIIISIN